VRLLVATGNKHKLEEFGRILKPLGITILSPSDIDLAVDVEETGETFAENARQKAEAIFRLTGLPTVADDSGLCVDALGGRPGVYSARYRGEDTPYPEKMAALLEELKDVPDEKRTARFACAICCVVSEHRVIACEETCEGTVAHAPSGSGGFGYDPLFLVGRETFADLPPERKDALSHRGKALRAFARLLEDTIKEDGKTQ